MKYDVFISYRRQGSGYGVAGEIESRLKERGYSVFLDVDKISVGEFPSQIEEAIKNSSDFLLILSPSALDRCSNPDDWVYKEITAAKKYGINIICLSLQGFVMPEPKLLPESINDIPMMQTFLWSHEYRSASFQKIEESLRAKSEKKKARKRLITISLVSVLIIMLCVFGFFFIKKVKEKSAAEEHLKIQTENAYSLVRSADSLLAHAPNSQDETDGNAAHSSSNQNFANYLLAIHNYEKVISIMKSLSIANDTLANYAQRRIDFADAKRLEVREEEIKKARILANYGGNSDKALQNALSLSKENEKNEVISIQTELQKQ